MTPKDVAAQCGFEDPFQYIARTGRGHTTSMLCDAVAVASTGKRVFILAFKAAYAQRLAAEARSMARVCGIYGARFEPRVFDWEESGGTRGVRDAAILRDHYRPI